jgi:CHAT domain-containing protein/tetratricopeptide (TPR) repeat protein
MKVLKVCLCFGVAYLLLLSFGHAQQDLWEKLNNQVMSLYQQARYAEAIPVAQRALEVAETTFGSAHERTATSLNNLAQLYRAQGRYGEAEPLYKRALEILEKALGPQHPDVATSLDNLAVLYNAQGRYGEAEPLYKRALGIFEKVLGSRHPDVATSLNNLAEVYPVQGRYGEAEPLYKRALGIYEKAFGPEHPYVATSLNNLAALYHGQGRYGEVEPLYKRALGIYEKAFGPEHPNVAGGLTNLAALYHGQGRYGEAEPLYKWALGTYEKALGPQHPYVATSLNNLAELYRAQGRYGEAEPLYKRAIDIREKVLGPEHPYVATSLNNLAALYYGQGRYGEVEPLCKRALSIYEKAFGPEHPYVATSLNNLAALYHGQGRYGEAEPLYKRALGIYEKALGPEHPYVATSLNNLALLYHAQVRYGDAEPLLLKGQQVVLHNIAQIFPSLSEKEKAAFYSTVQVGFEFFNSFAFERMQQNPAVLKAMFNNQLVTKALLFDATSKVNRLIRNSGDTTLITQFNSWISTKEYLAKSYTLTRREIAQQGIRVDSLEQVANDMEEELSRRSEAFKSAYEKKLITWQEVQSVLKPGEAAIEILRFNLYARRWTDTVYYAALIVTSGPKDHPELVLMENGNDLESVYIGKYRELIRNLKDRFAGEAQARQILGELYRQYWQKIQAKLKGIKRVYLSLDGVYNQINLLTLFNSETGRYLLEDLDIQIVTNTKDLVSYGKTPKREVKNTAELFGYPNYSLGTQRHEQLAANYVRERDVPIYGRTSDSLDRYTLTDLPGTKKEVETVEAQLKSRGWETRKHLGDDALEEAVKAANSPRVLVISTHGYFLEDVKRAKEEGMLFGMQTERVIENPLLRSGLMLAGAQQSLSNDSAARSEKADNGILTAYEAMNLDLDNTELVVLSACETGLGEVRNGEGVYGLQRAFQVAGARTIIMSLWKVSDEATQELMTTFFSNWLSGMTKQEAFKRAQLEVKVNHSLPYYWGAFVMVGE